MTYWWGWDVVEHWMLTGEFVWKLPVLGTWQRWKDPDGRPPCDWWGINYYSRGIFSWYLAPSCRTQEVMTDMYYPIYPEGMYRAIQRYVGAVRHRVYGKAGLRGTGGRKAAQGAGVPSGAGGRAEGAPMVCRNSLTFAARKARVGQGCAALPGCDNTSPRAC